MIHVVKLKVRKINQVLVTAFFLIIFLVLNHPVISQISIPEAVESNAKNVSILLRRSSSDGSEFYDRGSGVIIAKNNQEYYVLTSAHNLDANQDNTINDLDRIDGNYQIQTADNLNYPVRSYRRFETNELCELDLALLTFITFSSQKNYQTAKFLDDRGIALVDLVKIEDPIYVAGFSQTRNGFAIDSGKIKEIHPPDPEDRCRRREDNIRPPYPFTGGYSLMYLPDDNTGIAPGMSGGGVFNAQGYLIAIHGRSASDEIRKRGIGIDVFWNAADEQLKNRVRQSRNLPSSSTSSLISPKIIEGNLTNSDLKFSDTNQPFDYVSFDGRAGQTIEILLESTDFDPKLILVDSEDLSWGDSDILQVNDDIDYSGGNLNSRIVYTFSRNSTAQIIVNGYDQSARGAYTLVIKELE